MPNEFLLRWQLDVRTQDADAEATEMEVDSEPDESPTQKASKPGPSKQVSVRRREQPNHGRSTGKTNTLEKPVQGPSSSKNEYLIHFLSFTNVPVSLV
jgi:hypothetical protein